jgi:hypothetical protein
LILQNIETDRSIGVDVWVVDLGDEVAFGWPKGIIGGEVNVKEEDSARVGTVFGTDDGSLPVELVIFVRSSRTVGWGILF